MTYEKATVELIQFDNSDVITTSGCDNGNQNGNGFNNASHGGGKFD